MTADEINTVITALGSILTVLRDADPLDKAELYARVGRPAVDLPAKREKDHRRGPAAGVMYKGACRRGDLNHEYMILLRADLEIS